jgi:hypothetical protein
MWALNAMNISSRGFLRFACCRANRLRWKLAIVLIVLMGVLVAVVPAQAQRRPSLPNDDQVRVNLAIQQGYKFLLRKQNQDGSFPGPGHPVGVTSLVGLAILEAGSTNRDPHVLAAANYVITHWKDLKDTYDLALAILFLDRLDEPRKYGRYIQAFALRLIGGQTTTGGWTYTCPIFAKNDQNELLRVLRQLHEIEKQDQMPPVAGGGAAGKEKLPAIGRGQEKPAGGDGKDPEPKPSSGSSSSTGDAVASSKLPQRGMCIKTAEGADAPIAAEADMPPDAGEAPKGQRQPPAAGAQPEKKPTRRALIAGDLALLPVLQDLDKLGEKDARGKPDSPAHMKDGHTDNSNTQFAILAMWVAQRHGVPTERTLRLIVKRFRESQNPDGGWVYGYAKGGGGESSAAMTCAGLAGLAVGFGLADDKKHGGKQQADEQLIRRGFRCLVKFVGEASEKIEKRVQLNDQNNLYYLWSIERVAVMFNLKTIGGKDWYRWGVEILVTNQTQTGPDVGAWLDSGAGSFKDPVVTTCFALLFLRGANLASDLTPRLPFNPDDLNKDPGNPNLKAAPTLPGKGGDPLGPQGGTENDRPIDAVPPQTKPEEPATPPVTQTTQSTTPTTPTTTETKSEGGGKGVMIAIFAVVAILVIAGVGAGIYFATRGGKKEIVDDEDRPRGKKAGRRIVEEDEEDERPRARRGPPSTRAGGKRPSRARYDDDDDD